MLKGLPTKPPNLPIQPITPPHSFVHTFQYFTIPNCPPICPRLSHPNFPPRACSATATTMATMYGWYHAMHGQEIDTASRVQSNVLLGEMSYQINYISSASRETHNFTSIFFATGVFCPFKHLRSLVLLMSYEKL